MEILALLLSLMILGVTLYMTGMIIPTKLYRHRAVVKEKKVNYRMWWGIDERALQEYARDKEFTVPDEDYILITEKNQIVETTRDLYESVKVGDTITVTVYSNGVRKFIAHDV